MTNSLAGPRLFWPAWYLAVNDDVRNSPDFGLDGGQALRHYQNWGIHEGRSPNPFFDPKYYLNIWGDVRQNGHYGTLEGAWAHWLEHGIAEGRRGSGVFDADFYLKQYPDLVAAFGANGFEQAYNHWVQFGIKEGRRAVPDQDVPTVVADAIGNLMTTAPTMIRLGWTIDLIKRAVEIGGAYETVRDAYDWVKERICPADARDRSRDMPGTIGGGPGREGELDLPGRDPDKPVV